MTGEGIEGVTRTDRVDPARAEALAAALGWPGRGFDQGDPLPPFFHQVYFWDVAPEDELGPDGHRALGGLIPDLGLDRRMWAGGRLAFHGPLRAGIAAEKTTSLRGVTRKEGRSGHLGFVTLRHEIRQRGALVVTEDQDIVYRSAPTPFREDPPPPKIEEEPDGTRPVVFSPVALFRYSALTMNAHRIHYDVDFCQGFGYPGPVVHGPLLAQHLLGFALDRLGSLQGFTFRATAPLLAGEPAELCAAGDHYWVRGPDRRLCMTAKAS